MYPKSHRRAFLTQAAALTASGALLTGNPLGGDPPLDRLAASEPDAPRADNLPIIDTHQHLWDLNHFRLPWLEGEPKLRRNFVTSDFLAATKGLNIVRAVYMEVDVAVDQQRAEARHVIELCKSDDHPTVAAVISGRPGSEQFADYIQAYRESPYVKGVRQVLHAPSAQRGLCLQPTFVESVRLLGRLGMRFDLCMRPGELADGLKLAELCPDTQFVLDHCGNGDPKFFAAGGEDTAERASQRDQWRRDIGRLAGRKNVVCKISGIVVRATPDHWTPDDLAPIVNHCLDEFGPNRVMFGGDWPVCTLTATYAQWVNALKQIVANRTIEQQRKLFHDNAVAFYGLPLR